VALLVLTLARDCSRPRFILIGIGVSWTLAAAVGIFMTTADVRDVQTAMIWLAGSLQAATWPLLAVAFLGAARGHHPVLYRPGGGRGAAGRPDRHRPRRTPAAADPAALFRAGAADLGQRLLRRQPGFVGLMAPHMARFCCAAARCRCCAAAR
jgi:iron complex transport system permease protein